MLQKCIRGFEKTIQKGVNFGTLDGAEGVYTLVEMILYQTPLFAEAGSIWELRQGGIPTHPVINEPVIRGLPGNHLHLDDKDETRAA